MGALSKIQAAGFEINLDDHDNLIIRPSSKLTPNQREFLKAHKAEIISELKQPRLLVKCYTPSGKEMMIEAKDAQHADFLRRMNPKPEPVKVSELPFIRCKDCHHFDATKSFCRNHRARKIDQEPRQCRDYKCRC